MLGPFGPIGTLFTHRLELSRATTAQEVMDALSTASRSHSSRSDAVKRERWHNQWCHMLGIESIYLTRGLLLVPLSQIGGTGRHRAGPVEYPPEQAWYADTLATHVLFQDCSWDDPLEVKKPTHTMSVRRDRDHHELIERLLGLVKGFEVAIASPRPKRDISPAKA